MKIAREKEIRALENEMHCLSRGQRDLIEAWCNTESKVKRSEENFDSLINDAKEIKKLKENLKYCVRGFLYGVSVFTACYLIALNFCKGKR